MLHSVVFVRRRHWKGDSGFQRKSLVRTGRKEDTKKDNPSSSFPQFHFRSININFMPDSHFPTIADTFSDKGQSLALSEKGFCRFLQELSRRLRISSLPLSLSFSACSQNCRNGLFCFGARIRICNSRPFFSLFLVQLVYHSFCFPLIDLEAKETNILGQLPTLRVVFETRTGGDRNTHTSPINHLATDFDIYRLAAR